VVAFAVTQRNKELGIRIALGAGKKDIYRAVLGFSMRPVTVGLLIGLVITLGSISAVAQLFQDGSFQEFSLYIYDPITYAVAAILLAAAALSAMLVPARRATRVDPMAALRCE
jgi:putative ABC transport system permease protein